MRYLMTLSVMVVCLAIGGGLVLAGNAENIDNSKPRSEGRPSRRPVKTNPPAANVGFIADPVTRNVKPHGVKVAKKVPVQTQGEGSPTLVSEASLVAIKPDPTRAAPVVRDHTLPNPNAIPPNYHGPGRSDSINGGGLGLGNPFSFTAPLQYDKLDRDHRTNPSTPWTPSTQGPANSVPVKPTGRGGKK